MPVFLFSFIRKEENPALNHPMNRFSLLLLIFGCILSMTSNSSAATLADAEMQTLKERLLASFLPAAAELPATVADARSAMQQQQPDGSWPDLDYADKANRWPANTHLKRLGDMARALRAPKSPLLNAPQLRDQSLRALRFWLKNDYQNPNWWHNLINVPRQIGQVSLLLQDDLSPADMIGVDKILDRASFPNVESRLKTGANLVWLANNNILRGVFDPEPQRAADAFMAIWNEIKIAHRKDGIQPDWSFHQHGKVLQSGAYGSTFIGYTSLYANLARGTRFAIPSDKQQILESMLLDGQAWMTRGGRWDPGARGRGIGRNGIGSADELPKAAENLAALSSVRRPELQALITRFRNGANGAELQGNRHFFDSDFMAHHRPAYYASVRMFSSRVDNTDSLINNENRKAHHISDGANILMRRGDEYEAIFPVWDWLKIPGTTVEQNAEPLDPQKLRVTGQTSFVGGVSDGSYGVSAMQLQRDSLSARKAWFFFDNEYVCLGAGISDTAANPVATSVNQCLLRGEVTTPNGTATGAADLSGLNWVRHDGVNYLFPDQTNLRATIGPQSGKWSEIGPLKETVTTNVFSLWIDHGARPTGATYAYIVRPVDSGPPAPDAASNIEILSNTSDLQAVRQTKLKLIGVVFARAGRVAFDGGTLSVDQPCLLLCRQSADSLAVSLSNPENKALQVQVELTRGAIKSEAVFDLPDGIQAGSSVTQILK